MPYNLPLSTIGSVTHTESSTKTFHDGGLMQYVDNMRSQESFRFVRRSIHAIIVQFAKPIV